MAGVVHGREACVAEGTCVVCRAVCMAGGHLGGCAWRGAVHGTGGQGGGGGGACMAYGQLAGVTHPIGMHSCLL